MNTIDQPVAIVTGASSGIGLGITQAFLERGWRVVGTSRTISNSKDFKPSTQLVLVDGDASKRETAIQVVDAAIKHFDRIDLLVNNAGLFIPSRGCSNSRHVLGISTCRSDFSCDLRYRQKIHSFNTNNLKD
jgi:NAD(P)-dependent dehydrogenase (short-subunit alcohol dehydrogenase family)